MSGITYINRLTGATNNLVYLETSDTSSTAFATGYLLAQQSNIAAVNEGTWTWETDDLIIVSASDGVTLSTISSNFQSLIAYAGLAPTSQVVTSSSATPGTLRAITGKIVETATTVTSGNLVGVRGEVDFVGDSTSAYVYGVEGKLIPTGTVASGQFNAAVFGQFDIHAATINQGQMAPLWGDYGTTSGTITSASGLYGIAMTNTTAAVLAGQLYLYGGATNLMLLNDNNGLVGATYFQAAGTGSSSWGHATVPPATKVLQISVNGTSYWLPLASSNS